MTVDLLAGLRVTEAPGTLATAFAGRLLAAMGAEVRVVPGTPLAGLAGRDDLGPVLGYLGHGKEPGDPHRDPADLVLTDVRTTARSPGLLDAGLVVHLRMTEQDELAGPLDDGILAAAVAGASWAMGEPDRPPLPMPAFTADMLTGVVVAGVCAAVLVAGDTGVHEVSGTAALCAFADQNSTSYRLSGIGWRREGRRAPGSAGVYPYGVYPCKDGQVALIGRSTKDWVEIATALGAHDALAAFPDPFAIATRHADEADALLLPHLARHTRADVAELAETSGVLVAPVAEMADVLGYRDVPGQRPFFAAEAGVVVPGLPMRVLR